MSLPTKPYFIRALYEWCHDSGHTPYIAVFVNNHTRVPTQYVQDGQIVLNISSNATQNLLIDNEWITFQARFGGISHDILIPIGHIIGIFAQETGEGMGFEIEEWQPENPNQTTNTTNKQPTNENETIATKPKGPRLVK